ncbi:hypothetical protein ACLB2K_007312 [Fragaria x ananassa]
MERHSMNGMSSFTPSSSPSKSTKTSRTTPSLSSPPPLVAPPPMVATSQVPLFRPLLLNPEEEEEGDCSNKRKNSSMVWDHFIKMKNVDGSMRKPGRAKCKYCPQTYASDSRSNDPRYKVLYLDFFFPKLLAAKYKSNVKEVAQRRIDEVVQTLTSLFNFYTNNDPVATAASRNVTMPMVESRQQEVDEDSHAANLHMFKLVRYLILSKIAKDVFVVPVSTVASESAFSLEKRVVDPFRASLTPNMVEGLVCLSDWLRAKGFQTYKEPTKDEMEMYEELRKLEIGRQISDNIMIAQEILHKCKNAKGTKGFMAWKVDLSKAYDRLNWNFIEQVLYEVKIPIQLVKLIMSCVSTASYQIVLNGELSESFTGQSVSLEKSMVYCSPNVSSDLANRISSICGSLITKDLGVYLGMPLIHSRVSAATYANLVDKVQTRLASWKSKTLNMAGRLTLIQSVTSSIPIYAMQTAKLPVHTCERLDRLNRNFLWGDSDQKKKVHLTNWDMVCRPKCFGGLGIKRSADMNRAMLVKASWRMAQGDNGLWNKIYQQKYLHSSSMFQDNYKKPSNCSPTWTAIVSGASLLNKGMRWRIRNGCTAKFWSDKWSPCGILSDLGLIGANIDLHATISEFWFEGSWNLPLLYLSLPPEVVDIISAIPISQCDLQDKIMRGGTSSGVFSVKSAYRLLCDDYDFQSYPWLKNWSLNIPPMLKIFLWTFVSSKLLTNMQKVKRHLSRNPCCHHCTDAPETMLHLFRDCPMAMMVWRSFNISINMWNTFTLNWDGWLFANLMQDQCHFNNMNWNIFFIFCCWFIWKWRCKCIFEERLWYPYNFTDVILNYAVAWTKASAKHKMQRVEQVEALSWIKPVLGVHKLNVDGSRTRAGDIGAGGIIRDSSGCWCGGFMVNIGAGEVLQAEAWGLFYDIQLALSMKIPKLEIESDSAVLIKHIHRERNMVADLLAKNNTLNAKGICIFNEPPDLVTNDLLDDIVGVTRCRTVNTSSAG